VIPAEGTNQAWCRPRRRGLPHPHKPKATHRGIPLMADGAAVETVSLAVLEGDAADHIERVVGRRVDWRRTGIRLREAVGEGLRYHAADTGRAAGGG